MNQEDAVTTLRSENEALRTENEQLRGELTLLKERLHVLEGWVAKESSRWIPTSTVLRVTNPSEVASVFVLGAASISPSPVPSVGAKTYSSTASVYTVDSLSLLYKLEHTTRF